ncbi:MAG: hypothetical protein ACK5NT_12375 [Pyrinomonadaceae bacterium]
MKYTKSLLLCVAILPIFAIAAIAQENGGVFTGNIIGYNGPRVRSAFFTLRLKGLTSEEDTAKYVATLANDGQDKLLNTMSDADLGSMQIGSKLPVNVDFARVKMIGGKMRIVAVYPRTISFAELRAGYRSVDYPFSYLELWMDPKTGKGDGTFIAAAQIRWDNDNATVEVENFATYPAKLTNVTMKLQK